MVCVLGYERPADWDKDLRRQVGLFRKMGGLVKGWETVRAALKKLEQPPELIVDALLGRGREFEALAEEDQRTAIEVVGWANKSRAQVLAVEGPSGVGGSTGESNAFLLLLHLPPLPILPRPRREQLAKPLHRRHPHPRRRALRDHGRPVFEEWRSQPRRIPDGPLR